MLGVLLVYCDVEFDEFVLGIIGKVFDCMIGVLIEVCNSLFVGSVVDVIVLLLNVLCIEFYGVGGLGIVV